jgi:hypothetical protein
MVRDQYLRQVERKVMAAGSPVWAGELPIPSYHHLTRPIWLGWRGGLWALALACLGAVVGMLTGVSIALVQPVWVQVIAAIAYGLVWLSILAMWVEGTWTRRVYRDAVHSAQAAAPEP